MRRTYLATPQEKAEMQAAFPVIEKLLAANGIKADTDIGSITITQQRAIAREITTAGADITGLIITLEEVATRQAFTVFPITTHEECTWGYFTNGSDTAFGLPVFVPIEKKTLEGQTATNILDGLLIGDIMKEPTPEEVIQLQTVLNLKNYQYLHAAEKYPLPDSLFTLLCLLEWRSDTMQTTQKYTESQKTALIAAAAKLTGKPAAALTVEDAEAVLFEEVGVTVPATPMQAARRILIKNIEAEQQREREQRLTNIGKSLDIQAVFEAIPTEQAQALKQAAANISGKAAEDLTIEQAMQILERGNPNPAIKAAVDKIAEDAAAQISDEQWERIAEQLQAAAEAGTLQDTAISLMEQIPQAAQDAQEVKEETHAIIFDTGNYDKRLDPNTPEFDIEAYRKAIADAGGMEAMTERLKGSFEAVQKQMQETMIEAIKGTTPAMETITQMAQETIAHNAEALRDTAAAIVTTAQFALKGIADFVNSDTYKAIKESMAAISSFIAQHSAEIAALSDLAAEIQDLAPFLSIELEEAQKDPAFADYTLQDLLEQGFDADGNPTDSPFRQLIERAKQRQADFEAAEDTIETVEQAAEELPRIIANPTDLLTYPLDKPNSKIWNLLAAANPNGQLSLDIVTSKKGSKQDAIVYYGISFDELETGLRITKQLTPFDKRVYIAAAALFNGGNDVISATQIYKMMGNSGQPKAEQIQKINDSLTKMGAARVYLDNAQEVQVNKKYARFKYDASLLPFERISAYINNTLTESAIHLFREPPLITFARERGQITGLTRQLLESPISKTDANLQLEDYLLERIGHMKSPKSKAPRKMLFSTIYERCGIKTRNQRSRAPEKIRRYLDHYKKCGWIAGYAMDKDGVTIQIPPTKE